MCLAGTAHGVYRNVRLHRFGERTTASVVAVRQHPFTSTNPDGITTTRHTYKAVLSFTTVKGESVMAEECDGGRRAVEYADDHRGLACCAILVYIVLR